MDEQFLKDRARIIREMADKADPFIKTRLLDLAERYDRHIIRLSQTTMTVLSNRHAK
ncbi:hypothetical protein [Bradyrhizobium sp. CCBAU 11445]|uniref:hypothetical protein n=1 Tax=Bradyrhizobium sp. CCBAU 11445 TaxID=1630896 RepID=UPI002305842F|nr:hypothetical protein [Bradyrhizobium sp. CCBAU 11445]